MKSYKNEIEDNNIQFPIKISFTANCLRMDQPSAWVLNKIIFQQSLLVMNAIAQIRINLVLIAATPIALIYDVGITGPFLTFLVQFVNVFVMLDFMAQIAKIETQPSLGILAMTRLGSFATGRVKYVMATQPNAHVMRKMVIFWTNFYLL